MQLHHGKHHAAYVANFNAALGAYAEAEHKGDVGRMIALQPALKFNGGGASSSLLQASACVHSRADEARVPRDRPREPQHLLEEPVPAQGALGAPVAALRQSVALRRALSAGRHAQDYAPPSGDVLRYIEKDFGSLEALVKKFSAASVGVQGSGWGVRCPP